MRARARPGNPWARHRAQAKRSGLRSAHAVQTNPSPDPPKSACQKPYDSGVGWKSGAHSADFLGVHRPDRRMRVSWTGHDRAETERGLWRNALALFRPTVLILQRTTDPSVRRHPPGRARNPLTRALEPPPRGGWLRRRAR